jgi:hypothetical protein
MPGNKLYNISRMIDILNGYWYFGNIAKVKYHLNLSDKYLVEAKTLFEYKQYLLGVDALRRSTGQFQELPLYVKQGAAEQKDMNSVIVTISDAGAAHSVVLQTMKTSSPELFEWVPEKKASTELKLHYELDKSNSAVESVINGLKK